MAESNPLTQCALAVAAFALSPMKDGLCNSKQRDVVGDLCKYY